MAATKTNAVSFTPDSTKRIAAVVKTVESAKGDHQIGPPNDPRDRWIWAEILTNAYDSTNHVFKHAWQQMQPIKNGWATIPAGGLSGTTDVGWALNTITNILNTSPPLVSDFPVPTGTIVRMEIAHYWDSSTSKWIAQYLFAAQPPTNIHALITAAATAINGLIRWKYTIQLGHWNMASSTSSGGVWVNDSGSDTIYAFNSAEDMNTGTTTSEPIGTGNTNVSQADGTIDGGTCALLPLPMNGYVVVTPRGYDTTTTPPTPYYTIINAMNSAQDPPDSSSSS